MLKWMTRAVLDYYVQLFVFLSFFLFLLQSHTVLNKSITGVETYSCSSAYTCWSPHRCHFDAFVSFAMFFFSVFFRVCVFFSFPVLHSVTEAFHSYSCCLAQFRRWFFLHLYQRQCVVDWCYQLSSKFLSQRGLYSLCYCNFTAGLQSVC